LNASIGQAAVVNETDQRIGIIDLGSNSCRLVIFAFQPSLSFRLIDQVSERVRIGEGGFADARLQPGPMARAIQLLKMFRELCDASQIQTVIAVATSAVRDAANGAEFLTRVQNEAGLSMRVLSGDEEAYYAYLGAVNSLNLENGFVADLGGGSLELTRVRARMPVACLTLPLGAVRLTERFVHGDPISAKDERALTAHIDDKLASIPWLRAEKHDRLVVVGGTTRALANMDQEEHAYPIDRLHGYELELGTLQDQAKRLMRYDLKERLEIEGLSSDRADIIPAGATVIARLVKRLGVDGATVSGQGLREGLFYEEFLLRIARSSDVRLTPRPGGLDLPPSVALVPLVPNVRSLGIANIGYHYGIDWEHARHVCHLALSLFDQLARLHAYSLAERELLAASAILHDVGVAIDYYRHHRHSAYLIENADVPGFSHREIALISLLVRWHRQGAPKPEAYGKMLDGSDRERLRKLAAILRLAEDLERSRIQRVSDVHCTISNSAITIDALTRGPAEAELWAANRNDEIFRAIFDRKLSVRAVPTPIVASTTPRPAEQNVLDRAAQIGSLLSG
jgi:exopolyphosphatase/guanosine-5'-triphosphate,3'-diphosphate pyrophosphatase